jgi:RNA polymerase sigma-70 factor (family 1)
MAVYSSHTDLELTVLLKEGNAGAYTELFDRYQPLLFIYAYKLIKDKDEAADLVQEVFLYLWDKRKTLQLNISLLPYLYSAVRYKFFNLLDKQKVRADYAASLSKYMQEGVPLTDHYIREKEMEKLIQQQIALLPAKLREIYELSRIANMTTLQIAEALGMPEKTVKNKLSLAVTQLKVKLGLLTLLDFILPFDTLLYLLKKK